MENFPEIIEKIFDRNLLFTEFMKECDKAFHAVKSLGEKESNEVFQMLNNVLGTLNAEPNREELTKFFWFLARIALGAKKPITAYLAFDKARARMVDDSNIAVADEAMEDIFDRAFEPYASQSEAFEDYLYLLTNMVSSYGAEAGGSVTIRSISDLYEPVLELGFFEDFTEEDLESPRGFWDFLRVIRMRETATRLKMGRFSYLDLAGRFDLTTMEFLTLIFLYFALTLATFDNMIQAVFDDYIGMAPTVGMIDDFFRMHFGSHAVADDVLSPSGTLVRWGLLHLVRPEGMAIASHYQNQVILDDVVAFYLRSETGRVMGRILKTIIEPGNDLPPPTDEAFHKRLMEIVTHENAPVYIDNPDGVCVEDECLAALQSQSMGVAIFDLDRAVGLEGDVRQGHFKSAFLGCELARKYPIFEIAGGYKEQETRAVKECLADLQTVAEGVGRGFCITCPRDIFDLVYEQIHEIVYLKLHASRDKEQEALWEYWLGHFGIELSDQDRKNVLQTFPRVRLDVRRVLSKLRNRTGITFDMIKRTVYQGMDADFGFGAQRITPVFDWDSIVLPEETLIRVNEIITFYRYKDRVMKDWGFAKGMPYGKAISALLYGPPGTGKTMMAQVIAKDLNMDLFKVDLSSVLNKYIGETEKGLRRVFEAAQDSPTILVFDEADSLFTKRTEVKTSTDRYANVEVNYLLQKMEEFEGITILTTNNYGNIDEAFKRRIRFKIKFPMPDTETRARLWQVMLPAQAQVTDDLDFKVLGNNYEFSPAHIKNAVLRAAFMAAEKGEPIAQADLMAAAMAEARDLGLIVRNK